VYPFAYGYSLREEVALSVEKMVFRSLSVDPDVDEALKAEAGLLDVSKGVMFRRYLERGMASAARAPLPEGQPRLRVRTVYLPSAIDELLRSQAFDMRTSESDLIRRYLRAAVTAERCRDFVSVQPVAPSAPELPRPFGAER
jgi:hypothetical protein